MAETEDHIRLNTWAILDEIRRHHNNPSEFGRINQALLAIAFQNAGFTVYHYQGTGRPDFIADNGQDGFVLEVKAPESERVTLSNEDITGVEKLGKKAILAILTYPLIEARWLFIDTSKLSSKTYEKSRLGRLSIAKLEKEIAPAFLKALEDNKDRALIGSRALQELVESRVS